MLTTHVFALKVLNYDKVADTFIPVEPFKNETQNKIGVVTYNADEHFKVQITPTFNVSILLLSVIAIRKLWFLSHSFFSLR